MSRFISLKELKLQKQEMQNIVGGGAEISAKKEGPIQLRYGIMPPPPTILYGIIVYPDPVLRYGIISEG